MKSKNGWMAAAGFAIVAIVFATATHSKALARAENECLHVTFSTTLSSSATYGNLIVDEDATLTIAANVTLTLDGTSDTCTSGIHQIDGAVVLQGSGSTLRFTSIDQTLQGVGEIVGQNNAARIEIGSSLALTSNMTIEGAMVAQPVSGTASFVNGATGLVWANLGGGVLKLAANLNLADEEGALWKASASSTAELEFNQAVTGAGMLDGDFVVANCATIQFLVNVETTGSLTQTGSINTNGAGVPCFYYNWIDDENFDSICNDVTTQACQ